MIDDELVELYLSRNEDAVRKTEIKYGALLKKVIRNILNSEEDVNECLNDVYLALWQSIPPNKPEFFKAYAVRLAKNKALTFFRANTRLKRSPEVLMAIEELGEIAAADNPEEECVAEELKQAIEMFLDGLSEIDRKIMIRRYWFFDSAAKLGEQYGMSTYAVNMRLHRMRKKLASYLDKRGF